MKPNILKWKESVPFYCTDTARRQGKCFNNRVFPNLVEIYYLVFRKFLNTRCLEVGEDRAISTLFTGVVTYSDSDKVLSVS